MGTTLPLAQQHSTDFHIEKVDRTSRRKSGKTAMNPKRSRSSSINFRPPQETGGSEIHKRKPPIFSTIGKQPINEIYAQQKRRFSRQHPKPVQLND